MTVVDIPIPAAAAVLIPGHCSGSSKPRGRCPRTLQLRVLQAKAKLGSFTKGSVYMTSSVTPPSCLCYSVTQLSGGSGFFGIAYGFRSQ